MAIPFERAISLITQTIRSGFLTLAPSEDAVFDALALKAPSYSGSSNVVGYWRDDVAQAGGGVSQTGALVITSPYNGNVMMMCARIRGYEYSTVGAWEITLGGYMQAAGFTNCSYQLIGSLAPASIRAAKNAAGYWCLIIGSDAHVWQYPKISVDVGLGYTGATPAMTEGWTAGYVTDTTAYTLSTVVPQKQTLPVAQVTGAAPLAAPAFTGIPVAPTAAAGTNTTQLATTAFVAAAVAAAITTEAKAISFTAVKNFRYIITANSVIATLPAAPVMGDTISFVAASAAITGTSIARNGKPIMSLAEDITVDIPEFFFTLTYYDVTQGWRIT